MSYNLPEPSITSISNNDVTALIYQYQDASSRITFNNDISFFNIATNSNGFDLSSAIINPIININILPTNFQGFSSITHEAGFYLSDASLINGLTVTNDFDRFYYTLGEGSFNDISYTGSIFDICYIRHVDREDYIISFNEFQSDPSLIGEYRITYSLTNQNNYTQEITRNLYIEDTIPPEFGSYESNVRVNINNIYSEPGITFSDRGSRLKKLEYKIEKKENNLITTISNNTINDFSNLTTGNFQNVTLLNIEDTSNINIEYTITYTIYDNADLSSIIIRTIQLIDLNNLIIKPIIRYRFNSDTSFISQQLNADFSSNSPINYDISFYYLHSSKTIFYEATTTSNFTDLIDFSYDYDLPINSANVINDNLLFFDPIESIIPNKVNNYLVFFQIFNNTTFFNNIETINFKVIDTRGPKLEFESNPEYPFTDICNIRLPLLSNIAYQELSNNINYFNKLEETYPSFIIKNNDIIFSIPGIEVNDIVDGKTTTLSNESFDFSFINLYDISVSYYNIEKDLSNINEVSINNNKFVLNNEKFVEKYKTYTTRNYNFKNIKKENPLGFYIDNCNNYKITDYINYEPSSSIIYIQVDYSNNTNDFVFYDNSDTIITNSQLYFMTDVSYNFSTFNNSQDISKHHFGISGDILLHLSYDLSLIDLDSSFEICIPNQANNDISNIFYTDLCNQEYNKQNLEILVSRENNNYIKYYYQDISFTILKDISKNSSISIKSYKSYSSNNSIIENKNLFNNDFSSNIIETLYNIDASYLLTQAGNYVQNYTITDSNNNVSEITRNISIEPFLPFIDLYYNKDFSNNIYKKLYHKRYDKYQDLDARAIDFSYIEKDDISYTIVDNNFNKNNLGIQKKTYIAINRDEVSSIKELYIHIVDINILKKDIRLSSIIQDYSLNNPNNINSADYKRYGVYKNNTYNILTDGSSNAFRIVNDNSDNNIVFNDGFLDLSFSHLNNIVKVSSNNPIYSFGEHKYYYGDVSLSVTNDFNRLSIEYLDTSGTTTTTKTLKDIILYHECFAKKKSSLNEQFIEQPITNIIITVSNSSEYMDSTDVNKAYYLEINNEPIERKTLYLPLGKYKFKQKDYTNFYNPIKFSYLPDGHFFDSSFAANKLNIDLCNIGLTLENNIDFNFSSFNDPSYQKYEYVRYVKHFGLAGFNTSEESNNGCTTLIVTPTTPSPLFYYCKNFPKMGGIIYITTNVVLYKNIINLNGSILTKENQTTISYENYEPSYNEISNNLVFLSQHFDISHNNSSIFNNKKHHIIGLTQQNINHNIIFLKDQTSKETNKLIFKKYEDVSKNQSLDDLNSDFSYISNYKITENNSNNYLFDSSATQLKTDILMYDFNRDSASEIIDINDSYDYNLNKIFFNNIELSNYYYYFKKYNLLEENFICTSFKYRIGEIGYINPISITNSDVEINFYDNLFLYNHVIGIKPLFDNKINLNLQVYIDPLKLTKPEQRLDYYNSEKEKYYLSSYQNIIDPSKILFQEYFINILSDISGEFPATQATDEQSIIFSNGHIELNDYLLDSSYTNDFLEYIHTMGESNDLSLQHIVYLGFKDNSNNLFCGLTQQNIYHNMFIDDEYNIIFHPYTHNTNNNIYELNNTNNRDIRANNILKLKNNKNYLIEVSSNDLYNTLIPFDNSDNIYTEINVLNKNKYMYDNNYRIDAEFKFKTRISYKIYDELDNTDTKLNNLDIRPISLNGISPDLLNIDNIYQSYPYAYHSDLQEKYSHSFKINLEEHIDRNFYKNRTILREKTGLTYQNIHYSKLYYVIKDISYSSNFNLYDSVNNQNIIYDKNKIKTLNHLQSLIYFINFKMEYFYKLEFEEEDSNYFIDLYKLIGFTSYQDLMTLINGDFIDTTYSLELENVSLNQLFATVLYNSKQIVKRYNKFAEEINFKSDVINIIKINDNIYNINYTVKNSIDQFDQIANDINIINSRLTNAYNFYYYKRNPEDILDNISDNILDQSSEFADVILSEFKMLLDLLIDFNKCKQEYNQLNYELNLRGLIRDEDMSNNDFIDLYKFNDISGFYSALIDNMQKLNSLYLHDISKSSQNVKYITGKYWRVNYGNSLLNDITPEINFNNADFSISFFEDLSNSVINIDGENDFSFDLYSISYDKYDLSLLKYFSDEISNNKIVDISNIEIGYNNYYFYISGESYTVDTKKNFSYNKQNYYIEADSSKSNIGLLKEESYILNFNRSIYNQTIDQAYDYLTKTFNFDAINYILNGNELVINSFQSNNITIEFDVYYNSYLYPNKYLDTIVLDMFIPDLTPPTILFKTEVIDISQSSLANDISSIAQLLINDISYIDIYTKTNISINDDISFAYKRKDETSINYLDDNVDDSSFVNIYIDISQVANASRPNDITYVYYTIYDNVNNMNIVKRRVNVVDLVLDPIEFYYYDTMVGEYIIANGEDNFDLIIKKGDMLTDNKIMENIRAKDTETNTFIDLNNITYTLANGFVVNQIVTLEPKTYNDAITYTASGIYNNIKTINRNIRVLEDTIIRELEEKNTHCCYPAVYYKPIQHNYKLGSSNSTAMRMAKFIINN